MKPSHWLVIVAMSLITLSIWAWTNRPLEEPLWPDRVMGFAFSPYRGDQDPQKDIHPTPAQIDEDLALLAGKTYAVRTYTVEGVLGEVPRLAQKYGINVTLGAWISEDEAHNEEEIKRLVQIANANRRNIVRVMVGNETILHAQQDVKSLIKYIDRVRAKVGAPVSTAEPWHVWLKYPELVQHCDFIAVHMLPYWEGIEQEKAIDYIVGRMNELRAAYPKKNIIIGEVGWPSGGSTRIHAKAGVAEQATFLRRFLARASAEKYVYYVIEAFDQPWKSNSLERGVGSYWGVYNADREAKFPFHAPIVNIPQWYVLAGASLFAGMVTITLLFLDSHGLSHRGRIFLATTAYAVASFAVYVVYDYSQQYLSRSAMVIGIILGIGMIGVIVVLFAEAHEWAEAAWVQARRRAFQPPGQVEDAHLPWVSVHVPAYNEPPDMMIATLDALAHLDYPHFEVVVVDNNTKDPATWQPVRDHCAKLGARFRFFHEDPLAGFKAGALNYALRQTDPRAEVIAAIDSDYIVTPNWLRDLTPQFLKPEIAIVQAPQDYRDQHESLFKSMCYAEYRGFFYIGMVTRNERNAIIQHGTMTMVRRSTLEEVGGWAEWCITEDAELGLRVFERGYQAFYVPRSYGQGLMPDTFIDYKKQRFRWAYGAVRILRAHLGELLGWRPTSLTWGQRYHFLAGWMPWFADGLNLMFNLFALTWSAIMILHPESTDAPSLVFSVPPMILFVFKILKHIHLYYSNLKIKPHLSLGAAIAGLSLTHTISLAIIQGFGSGEKPFFRTPKRADGHQFFRALATASEEAFLMMALWVAAWGVKDRVGLDFLDTRVWITVLIVQSLPYLIAVIVAMISCLPASRQDSAEHLVADTTGPTPYLVPTLPESPEELAESGPAPLPVAASLGETLKAGG
ncbi:MAG: glycosyltransferase [Magnetococcales bacterium]|nr:glycosyltransferase [Magnetococcales bacterium]